MGFSFEKGGPVCLSGPYTWREREPHTKRKEAQCTVLREVQGAVGHRGGGSQRRNGGLEENKQQVSKVGRVFSKTFHC